jgi:cytochrome c biogenesis factor
VDLENLSAHYDHISSNDRIISNFGQEVCSTCTRVDSFPSQIVSLHILLGSLWYYCQFLPSRIRPGEIPLRTDRNNSVQRFKLYHRYITNSAARKCYLLLLFGLLHQSVVFLIQIRYPQSTSKFKNNFTQETVIPIFQLLLLIHIITVYGTHVFVSFYNLAFLLPLRTLT